MTRPLTTVVVGLAATRSLSARCGAPPATPRHLGALGLRAEQDARRSERRPVPTEPAPDAARPELRLVESRFERRRLPRARRRPTGAERHIHLRHLVVAELEIADAAPVVAGRGIPRS